jgi:hypothetical protein
MTKKPTLKQVQAVRCPTCGAGPGEKCELSTGQPRTEPHRDRRWISQDSVSRLRNISKANDLKPAQLPSQLTDDANR